MKYKLINSVSKIETICDKITIDGFDYYVSDEVLLYGENLKLNELYVEHTQTKPNRYSLFKNNCDQETFENCRKIVATNNPNIDIPKVVDGVDLVLYAKEEHKFNHRSIQEIGFVLGVKIGYQKSQETHPFSEKDMIEFSEWRRDFEFTDEFSRYDKEEILQIWKEQKPKIIYYEK